MAWYPLWNSLRIAAISTVIIFFAGIFAAYYIAKLPRLVKGVLDVLLTLPLVLPPTVVGYLLLRVFGPKRVIGAWALETFGVKMVMTWWSAIFATVVVIFPLMYRTVRGAFESFDETLAYSGQTLGLSNTYIFWRIRMPYCRQGVLAGTVLAFARALGEYGATSMIAGYTPGKTATISTTVVIFPLMYRTVRGAFEAFDETLAYSGQTLGLSNTYIFWRIRMPCCRQGVLAGTVLAFARALGEYGATSMIAGYTPGKTATISTTVYQLWQTNNDVLATKWVLVNIAISAVVLLAVNMLERRDFLTDASKARRARR